MSSKILSTSRFQKANGVPLGKGASRKDRLRLFFASRQSASPTQGPVVNSLTPIAIAFSQGKATLLAKTIIGVAVDDMTQCRSQINAIPGQIGCPAVTAEESTLLLASNRNPNLDAVTRANASALTQDGQVTQAAGVQPATLTFVADQRVAVGDLGDGITALGQGAGQHVAIYDAAENELTGALYDYYDAQKASGQLTPEQEQSLDERYDELLKIRAKANSTKLKTKKTNAKIDAANEQEVLTAQNEAFVEQVKDQIRDQVDIAPDTMQAAALLYVDQLNNSANPAAPAPAKAAGAKVSARRRGVSRRLH